MFLVKLVLPLAAFVLNLSTVFPDGSASVIPRAAAEPSRSENDKVFLPAGVVVTTGERTTGAEAELLALPVLVDSELDVAVSADSELDEAVEPDELEVGDCDPAEEGVVVPLLCEAPTVAAPPACGFTVTLNDAFGVESPLES
jgi:hypothetical protein